MWVEPEAWWAFRLPRTGHPPVSLSMLRSVEVVVRKSLIEGEEGDKKNSK